MVTTTLPSETPPGPQRLHRDIQLQTGSQAQEGGATPVRQHAGHLGYPGEGPEHRDEGAWVAVNDNVAGVLVSVSREASEVDVGEAGSAMIHDYTDKLWELVQVFKGSNDVASTHAWVFASTRVPHQTCCAMDGRSVI